MHNAQVMSNSSLLVAAEEAEGGGGGEEDATPKTGSWQNCQEEQNFKSLTEAKEELHEKFKDIHPDSDMVKISCTHIHYRVPRESINYILNFNKINTMTEEPIIIGVLSSAGGEGPSRRKSIRSTWAYRRQNVFFIVAGPWDEIQYEYDNYGDMLWIDKEEIYITETSVLTFKTESFVAVMYNTFMKDEASPVKYLFKADDDSYVDIAKLYTVLTKDRYDYWGKCNKGGWKPHRNKSNKWYISRESEYGTVIIYQGIRHGVLVNGAFILLLFHFIPFLYTHFLSFLTSRHSMCYLFNINK